MRSGLEAIEKEILKDARAAAEKQLQQAEEKAREQREARIRAEKKRLAAEQEKARQEAARNAERMITAASLESRKNVLAAKQRLIGEAFARSRTLFDGMDPDAYRDFMKNLVVEFSETGTETVVPGQDDRKILDGTWLQDANHALEAAGRAGNLVLERQPGDFQKGFILRGEHAEVNCRLESLIRSLRTSLEGDVAGLLLEG